MFEAETEVIQLERRLGRVGSIQAWDPWKSRRSVEDAKWFVSKIARLSHGLGEAEDFEAHFDRVVNQLKHESVLEFVPLLHYRRHELDALPGQSARNHPSMLAPGKGMYWGEFVEDPQIPASAFLVEAPIFVARQWMRHRSFAYLEMSRRYTKGSRVAWEYYGDGWDCIDEPVGSVQPDGKIIPRNLAEWAFWDACKAEYERRLSIGWPQEIARGCMPVETMTKFWVAGFDRDWAAFLKLRDDAHAQPEIRAFASWVRMHLEGKGK